MFAYSDDLDLAMCHVIILRTDTEYGSVFCFFGAGSTKILPKSTSVKGQISVTRAEMEAAIDLADLVFFLHKKGN